MLPIHDVLAPLKQAMSIGNAAVLTAPPGAGKTTVVPLALMDEPWALDGKLIVLEPRRLAARAAAGRMAQSLGEAVGETVGFRVRLQSKVSSRTRVEVVTEGVFTRMILDDPGLDGVAGVLFDEFHERSLEADLGLALAREAQTVLRADLRLLVMSATLDGARVAALLGDAPVLESLGRAFPVQTRYLGSDPAARLEDRVARAVLLGLSEEAGDLLVFLPGMAEIRRTEERLEGRLPAAVDLLPLHGALPPEAQDRAIAPPAPGRRKVVLATAIAETSLTLEGVRLVVDSGLSREPFFDPQSGLTRLETTRVSRAGADQRRGRAGRTAPGTCYRLWDEEETRALRPYARPEILQSDLSGLALDLAQWGTADPAALAFLDPPPARPFQDAVRLLKTLGALDASGAVTAHGRRLSSLSLPPRLAHMVLKGADRGAADEAALIAAALTERGLGGTALDLGERLIEVRRSSHPRARDARRLAAGWAARARAGAQPLSGDPARLASSPVKAAGRAPGAPSSGPSDGSLLLAAYPERLAQSRGGGGEFKLASGRGVFVDPAHALARSRWIVAADLGGGAAKDRVLLAAPLEAEEIFEALGDQVTSEDVLEPGPSGRLSARRVRRIGALVLSEEAREADPALIAATLLEEVRRQGVGRLPWSPAAQALRARSAFARSLEGEDWPDLGDEALQDGLEDWLGPLLEGVRSLAGIDQRGLEEALVHRLGWERRTRLDRIAPPRFTAPTGSTFSIDYLADTGPTVEVRVQELFGLRAHPSVGDGRAPLTLALTSPARRPIQVTRDLPGFWRGSWADVRREMRGRYPKHPWPEDPAAAAPTARAKPRGG